MSIKGGIYIKKGVYNYIGKKTAPSAPGVPAVPVVIGIDPGLRGAIVLTDGVEIFEMRKIPLVTGGREIHFQILTEILVSFGAGRYPIFLERAIPMAMGSKSAFSYGAGFERIIRAIEAAGVSVKDVVRVEPSKWTKEMHAGISKDLKPKAKSLLAVERLFPPPLVGKLPKNRNGVFLDGPVDALLIAGYGLRRLTGAGERATGQESGLAPRHNEGSLPPKPGKAEKEGRSGKRAKPYAIRVHSAKGENDDFY